MTAERISKAFVWLALSILALAILVNVQTYSVLHSTPELESK